MNKNIRTVFYTWQGKSAVHIRNQDDLVYDPKNDRFAPEAQVENPFILSVQGTGLFKSNKVVIVPTTAAFRDGTYLIMTHDMSVDARPIMDCNKVNILNGQVDGMVVRTPTGFVI